MSTDGLGLAKKDFEIDTLARDEEVKIQSQKSKTSLITGPQKVILHVGGNVY